MAAGTSMSRWGGALSILLVALSLHMGGSWGWTGNVHRQIAEESINHIMSPWREVWELYREDVLRGVGDASSWRRIEAEYYDPSLGEGEGPLAVTRWFENMKGNLTEGYWADAFYSSGILSHYASSLCDPFNTITREEYPQEIHEQYAADVEAHFDELTLIFTIFSEAASEPSSYAMALATLARRDYNDLLSTYTEEGWSDRVEEISQRGVNRALQATVSLWNQSLIQSGAQPPETSTTTTINTPTEISTTTETTHTSTPSETKTSQSTIIEQTLTTTTPESISTTTHTTATTKIETTQSTIPQPPPSIEGFNHLVQVEIGSEGSGEVTEVFSGILFEENLEQYGRLGDEGYKDLVETEYAQKGFRTTGVSVRVLMDEEILEVKFTIPGLAVREDGYYSVYYSNLMGGVDYRGREDNTYFFASEEHGEVLKVSVPPYAVYVYLLEDEGKVAYYLSPIPGWGVLALILGLASGIILTLRIRECHETSGKNPLSRRSTQSPKRIQPRLEGYDI